MINCRHQSIILRSKHTLISLLKSPKKALKNENRPKNSKQISQQRCDKTNLLGMFPKEFHRKTNINTKMSRHLYLDNETIAAKIAKHLTGLPDQSITFVVTNPGPGMLTDLLVKSGMKDLRLYEGREEFLAHLEETYTNVYPDRVKLKHADLINLNLVLYTDEKNHTTKADEILSGLPTAEWQDNINFRLFGATGSTSFFKQLIHSILFQSNILALGRCELYMVVPSIIYIKLTSSHKTGYEHYRAYSTLFQIFFEYELLDKFPRTDFLPYIVNTAYAIRQQKSNIEIKASLIDPDLMYFVKIVPRRDLYQLIPPDQIQQLWHFLNYTCFSRHNQIIPTLEKLIPGCGTQLLRRFSTQTSVRPQPTNKISLCEIPPTTNPSMMTLSHQDYYDELNIFTEFGDLQPTELLTLFSEFRMLPTYFSCNFLPSLENNLLKIRAKQVDVDTKPTDVHGSTDVEVEKQCDIVKET